MYLFTSFLHINGEHHELLQKIVNSHEQNYNTSKELSAQYTIVFYSDYAMYHWFYPCS